MATNEIWAWCPYCGELTPAKKNWRNRLICDECGEDLGKEAEFYVRDCPECGRHIYAPGKLIDDLVCPCGAGSAPEPEPEPAPEPAPEPEPEPEPELELTCRCGGIIECVDGVYRCPVCGTVFSEDEIHRKKYFAEHDGSINIEWDNSGMAGRVLYVHPHSGSIGYRSALIVREYQGALYDAGGEYRTLGKGTWSLFWDDRSERDIRETLDYGRYEDERPIQLGTKVIFFDKRGIDREFIADKGIAIRGTDYVYWPRLEYKLSISDPLMLMGNSFNFATDDDGRAVQSRIVEWAEGAIFNVLSRRIRKMTGGDFAWDSTDDASELADLLEEPLDQDEVGDAVSKKLRSDGRGIQVRITAIDVDSGLHKKLKNPAVCPHCGGEIGRRDGIYECPLCGKKLWICPFCGTANKGSVNICTNDGRRGPY